MGKEYKEPNKSKGDKEYKNRRGSDALSGIFGGMLGDTVKKMKKHNKKVEKADKDD